LKRDKGDGEIEGERQGELRIGLLRQFAGFFNGVCGTAKTPDGTGSPNDCEDSVLEADRGAPGVCFVSDI
jgi:hypothetical protein